MDEVTGYVQQNSSMLSTIVLLIAAIAVLYAVYTYMYPADDPSYAQFLKGEADARRPVRTTGRVPTIYTGGDFTLSFWIYVDDWSYKASSSKFLFAISPEVITYNSRSPLVGLLTPLQNGLMVRASTVQSSTVPMPGEAPGSSATPDITVESTLDSLLKQQTSMSMFQTTLDAPCDVKEVPLQRWVCITIVSSGRVLDVYLDGKLSRSCVLDNVVNIPRGPLKLRLGESGGFGGRYSSIQMWNQQLTPDVIYGIYQMGPVQTKHDLFSTLSRWLNINVTYTGSAPGQPIVGDSTGSIASATFSPASAMEGLYHRL